MSIGHGKDRESFFYVANQTSTITFDLGGRALSLDDF
jgi:hypothetical protein